MIQGNTHQSETENKDISLKDSPILVRLLKRAVVFLVSLLLALTLFYIAGCIQFFLEQNLHLILFFITSVAIALTILSLTEIAACIYYALNIRRTSLYFHIIPFSLTFLAGLFFATASQTITLLETGL